MDAILIDGQYLYEEQKHCKCDRIDFGTFLDKLTTEPRKVWYFTNDIPGTRHDKFLEVVRTRGARVVKGNIVEISITCPHCGHVLTEQRQKQVDVAIAVVAMQVAPHADRLFLVTGDSDFVPLLNALETVTRTILVAHNPLPILKEAADQFIELHSILRKCRLVNGGVDYAKGIGTTQ